MLTLAKVKREEKRTERKRYNNNKSNNCNNNSKRSFTFSSYAAVSFFSIIFLARSLSRCISLNVLCFILIFFYFSLQSSSPAFSFFLLLSVDSSRRRARGIKRIARTHRQTYIHTCSERVNSFVPLFDNTHTERTKWRIKERKRERNMDDETPHTHTYTHGSNVLVFGYRFCLSLLHQRIILASAKLILFPIFFI